MKPVIPLPAKLFRSFLASDVATSNTAGIWPVAISQGPVAVAVIGQGQVAGRIWIGPGIKVSFYPLDDHSPSKRFGAAQPITLAIVPA
jgi:hypothetical protein